MPEEPVPKGMFLSADQLKGLLRKHLHEDVTNAMHIIGNSNLRDARLFLSVLGTIQSKVHDGFVRGSDLERVKRFVPVLVQAGILKIDNHEPTQAMPNFVNEFYFDGNMAKEVAGHAKKSSARKQMRIKNALRRRKLPPPLP